MPLGRAATCASMTCTIALKGNILGTSIGDVEFRVNPKPLGLLRIKGNARSIDPNPKPFCL